MFLAVWRRSEVSKKVYYARSDGRGERMEESRTSSLPPF